MHVLVLWISLISQFSFSGSPAGVALSSAHASTIQNGATPAVSPETHSEVGLASFYAAQFHRRRTASGESFDQQALTAAHRTLPLGTQVRVTNLDNDQSVVLTINDRGPFRRGRIIDVSRRASRDLGFHDRGLARVRVEVVQTSATSGDSREDRSADI